jgi:hypothetical protein
MSRELVRSITPTPSQSVAYQYESSFTHSLIREGCMIKDSHNQVIGYDIFGAHLPSATRREVEYVSTLEDLLEEIFRDYPTVKKLRLINCDFYLISKESSIKIAAALSKLPCKSIEFVECLIDFADFEKLKESKNLETLVFRKMTFTETLSQHLVNCLNFSLKTLGFIDCEFDEWSFLDECRQQGIPEVFVTRCTNVTVIALRNLARLLNQTRIDSMLRAPEESKMKLQFRIKNTEIDWTVERMVMIEDLFVGIRDMKVCINYDRD